MKGTKKTTKTIIKVKFSRNRSDQMQIKSEASCQNSSQTRITLNHAPVFLFLHQEVPAEWHEFLWVDFLHDFLMEA